MRTAQKRFMTLALALTLLLASCGESAVSSEGENTTAGDSASPAVSESAGENAEAAAEEEADSINILAKTFTPEIQKELGLDGYNSVLMLRNPANTSWSNPDIVAEELNGDRLNDAVFNRNEYLADTFGFTLEAQYSAQYCEELKTAYIAGDSTYDFAFPQAEAAASLAQTGALLDLAQVPNLNFDNPTWSRMFIDMLSYKDKLFYATGDISVNTYQGVRGLLFNKDIRAENNLDDPYTLVREGRWTLDAFNQMCITAPLDLDGDGAMTKTDRWGMAWQSAKGGMVLFYGCDEHLTVIGEEKVPVISVGSERSYSVYDRVRDLIANKNAYYQGSDGDTLTIFQEGRSLFMAEVLNKVTPLRESEFEFGILPPPKYDEAQENYMAFADGHCISPVVIPSVAANQARSGFIVEAFAEASCSMIKPEYYDVILKSKLSRDEESGEMLDIIYKNFVIDNAAIYKWGDLEKTIREAMNNGKDLASLLARTSVAVTKAMEKTFQSLEEAGQ